MNRSLYPPSWEAIAHSIKAAANWQCQECGKPCCPSGMNFWDFAASLPTEWAELLPDEEELILMDKSEEKSIKAFFTLTTAHLNHQPSDCRPENLKALCAPCHLKYDNSQRSLKKRLKQERQGQLTLLDG